MDDHFALLADIEAFCRVQGIAESTFGRQVVNDGKFVGRLRCTSGGGDVEFGGRDVSR